MISFFQTSNHLLTDMLTKKLEQETYVTFCFPKKQIMTSDMIKLLNESNIYHISKIYLFHHRSDGDRQCTVRHISCPRRYGNDNTGSTNSRIDPRHGVLRMGIPCRSNFGCIRLSGICHQRTRACTGTGMHHFPRILRISHLAIRYNND